MDHQWSLRKGLFFLFGSTGCTLLLSLGIYCLWLQHKQSGREEGSRIVSITQTGPEKNALKTAYLAELLSLSSDQPTFLKFFDCEAAEKKLLLSPLIKSASVKKNHPNGLYIDYEIRKPIALLSDYQNVAIDEEGYLFPFAPYFTPKEIPEMYLGLPPFGASEDSMGRSGGGWLAPLENRYFRLALDCVRLVHDIPWKEGFQVKRIDFSNAFAVSLGSREIVLFTEEEMRISIEGKEICSVFPKILRLSPKDFEKQLHQFFLLRRSMAEDYVKQLSVHSPARFAPRIVDLRIPQLAFVENRNNS